MTEALAVPSRPSVVRRVEHILEAVGQAQVIGVSALSRNTGLPKTTTDRIANELVEVGMLERAGDGFRLGFHLFELGNQVIGPKNLREAALPVMEQMLYLSKQTIHLAVRRDDDVSYIERIFAHRPSELPSSVAGRLPLHCTATGKCFLAFGDPSGLRLNPRTVRRLADEIDVIREHGIAFEYGEVMDGVTSVAAPIFTFGNTIAAAMAITGFMHEFDPEEVAGALKEAARGLSRSLGAPLDKV